MCAKQSKGVLSKGSPANEELKRVAIAGVHASSRIDLFSIGVLNSVSAHIAVLGGDGEIVAVNDAWKQFARENDGDMRALDPGANYFSACMHATQKDEYEIAAKAVDGIKRVLVGEMAEFELEYACHSQDEQRWFLMRATPMQFSGNKVVVSHINITDKKKAEKRIAQREKELSALHIISRAVSASISLDSVTKAILEQISATIQPDMAMVFIKKGEDLILKGAIPDPGSGGPVFMHSHRVGQCLCGLSVYKAKSVFSENIHKDDRCTWQECKKAGITSFAAIPLISKHEVIGTLGIASIRKRNFEARRQFVESMANDVAIYLENSMLYEKIKGYAEDLETQLVERKKMEKMLRQTQKMEAIGKLAGGIAHDFNNMLSPIIGYTELTLIELVEGTQQHANLMEVQKAGHRAKDLVQQILTFTRQSDSEQNPIDLSALVFEAVKFLRSTFPSTIEIVHHIPREVAPIQGDATQIHQIMMNLCTNAAQAMEAHGGILEVTLEQVYWDSKYIVDYKVLPKGPYFKLSIGDTGIGMAPEILESIFDPYFTTKEKGKGTGLGLAVVQGIISSHRGEINVYSEPNIGSTFTIYFPALSVELAKQQEDLLELPVGKASLLFVDDEIAISNMARQLLEQLGYTVTAMTNSLEALQLFKNDPYQFDAVISDMTMPHLRGDQLAEKMLIIRPDLPVILCTGFSRHITKERSNNLGVRALLQKPFTLKDLAITLKDAIGNRSSDSGEYKR